MQRLWHVRFWEISPLKPTKGAYISKGGPFTIHSIHTQEEKKKKKKKKKKKSYTHIFSF